MHVLSIIRITFVFYANIRYLVRLFRLHDLRCLQQRLFVDVVIPKVFDRRSNLRLHDDVVVRVNDRKLIHRG